MSKTHPSTVRRLPAPRNPLVMKSASELARMIAAGEVSSVEVVKAHRERYDQVHGALNAIVVPLYDEALVAAQAADAARSRGESLGPLHGVPFTVKECFSVVGTPSTIGLTARVGIKLDHDAVLVDRLRRTGGILLGKTNVPQLMMWHESDNPVYGCTNNPLDLDRTPGGSSGGEAAAVAAHCSPLGLGNDLGGSIRVPAHWCGIAGFKPTTQRLTRRGSVPNFRGMTAMLTQAGPMARNVDDLILALRVLHSTTDDDVIPVPLDSPEEVRVESLRVACWDDDGYFPACAAAKRIVREAAQALSAAGVRVEFIAPPKDLTALVDLYFTIMGADGGHDARRLVNGSRLDWRLSRILFLSSIPQVGRRGLAVLLRMLGDRHKAHLISITGPRSADEYWQACYRLNDLSRTLQQELFGPGRFDAVLCPPHALAALPHGEAIELLPAASYSMFANLLGLPAGTVPFGKVELNEADQRFKSSPPGSDSHLPVGIQVVAPRWKEHFALRLLQVLEELAKNHLAMTSCQS